MSEIIRKAISATDFQFNEGEHSVIGTISTAAVDRSGQVLVPAGCNTKNYELNPIVLYMHDHGIPIGRCTSIKRTDRAITAKAVFAERPKDHPEGKEWFPSTVYHLYREGVLNAFSVGFRVQEIRRASKVDRDKYGADCEEVISKWELYEFSAVTVPANQDAVAIAVSKGVIGLQRARDMFDLPDLQPAEPIEPKQQARKSIVYIIPPAAPEPSDTGRVVKCAIAKARGATYVR